jgi:hypothetical protein
MLRATRRKRQYRHGGASLKETWLASIWQSKPHQIERLYHYIGLHNAEKVKIYIDRIRKWEESAKIGLGTPGEGSDILRKAAGLACQLGHREIVKLFVGSLKYVDIHHPCDISKLIFDGHRDLAKIFIENKDRNLWCKKLSARDLELARTKGWDDIAELIQQKMASPTSRLPISRTTLEIPEGAENVISFEKIKNGNDLVDFDNESKFKRYYLKSTYDELIRRKQPNPHTRKPIKNARHHTAKIIRRS